MGSLELQIISKQLDCLTRLLIAIEGNRLGLLDEQSYREFMIDMIGVLTDKLDADNVHDRS